MKKIRIGRLAAAGIISMASGFFIPDILPAQTSVQGVSETSASIGVGISRFNSGYIPIDLSKPNIRPGQPFDVRPTMDSLVSKGGGGGSFGGLLNRYDMTNFGKFFVERAAAASAPVTTRNLPTQEKAVAVNAEGPQMYPPRLSIDENQYPSSNPAAEELKQEIRDAYHRIIEHYPLNRSERVEIKLLDGELILCGMVHSQEKADALQLGLGLVPGIDRVSSQLYVVPSDEPKQVDPLGYEQYKQ